MFATFPGMTKPRRKDGPMDGSTSGTIGGGGPQTGGPATHPDLPDMPPVRPENAASGRLEQDPRAAAVATPARADESDKLTYLTFSKSVQLPGVTLPAGRYRFQLADTQESR